MKKIFFLVFFLFFIYAGNFIRAADFFKSSGDKVFVVAHRADWRNFPENSIPAIESCIKMGVDMVEIDVRKTEDGHLVLMHDKTVNATTNGEGLVSKFTLEEIKQLKLSTKRKEKGYTGYIEYTEYSVPTLEEALETIRDRILINIDKADSHFDEVYKLLIKTRTLDQALIKSGASYESLLEKHGDNFKKMTFMPVIGLKETTTIEDLNELLEKEYVAYEFCFSKENKKLMLEIQDKLKNTTSLIWINTLWKSLCGKYHDDNAVNDPAGTYGYLIDSLGARVLQTDRPLLMIDYLKKRPQYSNLKSSSFSDRVSEVVIIQNNKTLEVLLPDKSETIEIFDLLGRKLAGEQVVGLERFSCNVESLNVSCGIYILWLTGEFGKQTKKFYVN